jgi:hypothetical protein
VRDALDMRRWLMARDGGAVPKQNLIFLASPSSSSEPFPPGVATRSAARDEVVLAVMELLQRSRGDEGRLFVYFAGHGLTVRADFYDEPALICADFTPRLTTKAITVRAIKEQCLASTLTSQFFIFDACRNMPFPGEFRVSAFDRPSRPDYSRRVPDQFECSATSPGLRAHEMGAAGDERGAFTSALMRGLAGAGRAKRFDPAEERYVVRFDDLFQYTVDDVRSRKLGDAHLFQEPTRLVSGTELNPVLATFAAGTFAAVDLEVTVEPPTGRSATSLEVAGPYDSQLWPPPLRAPLVLALEPRAYSLRARAPGLASRPPGIPVELYEPQVVRIDLFPEDPALKPVPTDRDPFREPSGAARPGRFLVETDDPLATVEAVDEGGDTHEALGELLLTDAGRYRVHVRTPDGVGPSRLIEVIPGSDGGTWVAPPIPPRPEVATLGIYDDPQSPEVSEILENIWRYSSFRPVRDGNLMVAVAPERLDARDITASIGGDDVRLRFVPIRRDFNLQTAMLKGRPGPGMLRLANLGHAGVEIGIPVHIEANRPTIVTVEFDAHGRLAVYQHGLPHWRLRESLDVDAYRAADLAERFARQGRWRHALQLLEGRATSPIALSLRGYLLLASGADPDPVQNVAEQLLARDQRNVDAQMIRTLIRQQQGASESEIGDRVGTALKDGYPVLDMGLAAAYKLSGHTVGDRLPGRHVPDQVVTTFAIGLQASATAS